MKKIKILVGVLAVILVLFFALSIVVSLHGKKFIESRIEQSLKMKVSLGKISLGFPLSVNIKNLELGNIFKADVVSFSPNLLGLMAGKVVLDGVTITRPLINLEQSPEGKLNLPQIAQKGKQPPVFLTGLTINNGKLIFTDKKISAEGYKTILEGINLKVSKVMLPPTSLNTRFNLSANFLSPDGKALGSIDTNGWIDFRPKNMDAIFQIKDLEVTHFSPYYGDFISSRKILSGKLNFTSYLKAKNNDLKAECKLLLSGLTYEQQALPEGETKLDLFKSTLDFFTDKEGNLNLEFEINTRLDKPAITRAELHKIILNAAKRNLSNQSPQELYEKVSDTVKQFKKFGKELKDIFKNKE
ncbi:MAG: DUF748 domain-containing protein [Candidatus Omnitrophica bacterium]|nr:DUF748 domain-containing protein [Candidatus Omnitrophota bacterium]